jgi:hypothetical protein
MLKSFDKLRGLLKKDENEDALVQVVPIIVLINIT